MKSNNNYYNYNYYSDFKSYKVKLSTVVVSLHRAREMYQYTDDQNSCKKLTAQIPMKTTIICLPPTLHTCQNVPAAIITSATDNSDSSDDDSCDTTIDYYDKNSGYSDNPDSVATGTTSCPCRRGSCCHHWEHKNYDYEKYEPTTTTTTTTTIMVATATPTRQHNHQKGKRYNKNQSSGNNNFSAPRSRNCSSNNNNNSTNRERCRNFYNLNENITSLRLSKTSATSSQYALETESPSPSPSPSRLSLSSSPSSSQSSFHCRTKATENAKNAESTTKTFRPGTKSSSRAAADDSTSSSICPTTTTTTTAKATAFLDLFQMNGKEKLNLSNSCAVELANERSTPMTSANKNAKVANRNRKRNGNAVASWNARFDDSFTLRTKQLVMTIDGDDDGGRTFGPSANRLENIIDMVCERPEMQTQFVTSYGQALVKEMDSIDVVNELSATATISYRCYRSTFASVNNSQTTKTQFAFGGLCSRATNAGDIQTDGVKNFVEWSDGDVDKDYANDGKNGSDGNRNIKSDNATRTNSIEQQKLDRNPNQKQQQQQEEQRQGTDENKSDDEVEVEVQVEDADGDVDGEEHDEGGAETEEQHATLLQHIVVPSENLQRIIRSSEGRERRQLWQKQMPVTAAAALQQQQKLQQLRHQVVKMLKTPATKFLSTLMLLMLITNANCWAGRQDVPSNCTFPLRWEGSWFLSGYQQSIHIKGSQISYRGRCAASEGNKYLIVDEKGCHRCLVIYEKHENVLQYKESECEGDSMYMHQQNPSAMAMRSVLKQNGGEHRGGAHPNTNGHSRLSSSDQYIMRSNDDMNDCPPDFCKGRETLQNLCDQIPGDALLYSLFRESAEPVKCPLKGPFIFTYNRGHGECKSPVSNIESCTEESRLLLSFQACPDVQGTESTVEELTCLAAWKDGNSRYLVGLVSHHHAISNEERYRCFVYEKISSLMGGPSMISSKDAEYKLAQSGDATCNGLDSAEVGSRIMTLRKPPVAERCDFPVWFKGPRHWHALMGNAVYNYHTNDGSVHIIKPNGYMETRALCEQINKQTSTEMMAVVHYTTGCQSGFMCMMFYRRDTHVIEIQTGKQASRLEDACAPDHFDIHKMPYITLLASNPDPQICPMEGLYNLRGAIGPPYLTTRHKRNHNNKLHNLHGHHRFSDGFSSSSGGGMESGSSGSIIGSAAASDSHKRRGTLSFRSSDRIERGSWHANTRGLPARSRRDAIATEMSSINGTSVFASAPSGSVATVGHVGQTNDSTLNRDGKELLLRAEIMKSKEGYNITHSTQTATLPLMAGDSTSTMLIAPTDLTVVRQRNRRDVPGCVTNFKAQRQLWVGCTEPNVIDVRPLCNDEGDEEYYCHGSWTENTTVYIIARHKRTKHGVCISYRPTEGSSAKLVIGDACYRGSEKPPEHHLVANLSVFGKCGETGSYSSSIPVLSSWTILAVAILATFFNSMRMISPFALLNANTDVRFRR